MALLVNSDFTKGLFLGLCAGLIIQGVIVYFLGAHIAEHFAAAFGTVLAAAGTSQGINEIRRRRLESASDTTLEELEADVEDTSDYDVPSSSNHSELRDWSDL